MRSSSSSSKVRASGRGGAGAAAAASEPAQPAWAGQGGAEQGGHWLGCVQRGGWWVRDVRVLGSIWWALAASPPVCSWSRVSREAADALRVRACKLREQLEAMAAQWAGAGGAAAAVAAAAAAVGGASSLVAVPARAVPAAAPADSAACSPRAAASATGQA